MGLEDAETGFSEELASSKPQVFGYLESCCMIFFYFTHLKKTKNQTQLQC